MSNTKQYAVVTGASSGIGYELAKQFAQNDFDLFVTSTDQKIEQAAKDFRALGAHVDTFEADLATYEGVDALYQAIQATGRAVDAAALNAGVGVGGDFAHGTDLKDEINLINLNIVSTVHLSKHLVRDMVDRGSGHILYTSSVAALMPGPFYAVYAASKSFVQSFAEALRNELKDSGVVVTALQPGPTDTNFFEQADMQDTPANKGSKEDPALVAKQGFEALMGNKDHVVGGGLKTKVQAAVTNVLPSTANAAVHRSMTEPESDDK